MTLPFRDGEREVPDHIALWMTDIDTARMTYEEALVEMNQKQERDFLNRAANRVIMGHFQGPRES
jgi:hypothetical protein